MAILRSIDVGGKNLIAMGDLLSCPGHGNARTHGRSGNVLSDADHRGGPALEATVEQLLGHHQGVPIPW